MPVPFKNVVRVLEIGPIPGDEDEPVLLRVEILHDPKATPPYSARIWRRAAILLRPADGDDEPDETAPMEEFRILVEDDTIGAETFAGNTPEAVIEAIRDRIEAIWYMSR